MSTIVPTIKDNRLFAVDVHREVADKETGISWSTRIIHHFSPSAIAAAIISFGTSS